MQPWPEKIPHQQRKLWVRFCGTHDGAAVPFSGVQPWIARQNLRSGQRIPRSLAARFDEAIAEADDGGAIGGDERTYEVERLLESRMCAGRRQFLVRWRGYERDLYQDTWEDEESILDNDLITAFDAPPPTSQASSTTIPSEGSAARGNRKRVRNRDANSEGDEAEAPGVACDVPRFSLKVIYEPRGDGGRQVRRFAPSTSFVTLETSIDELAAPGVRYLLTYMDDEGDEVTVHDEASLREAVRMRDPAVSALRLTLRPAD